MNRDVCFSVEHTGFRVSCECRGRCGCWVLSLGFRVQGLVAGVERFQGLGFRILDVALWDLEPSGIGVLWGLQMFQDNRAAAIW